MSEEFSCGTCRYFDAFVDYKGKPDPDGNGECNYHGRDTVATNDCDDWEAHAGSTEKPE